jgi:2-hydroxy-3-oxopropionate reductase
MRKKVGFIGLGIMGTPMVSHLLHAGYEVMVSDLNQTAVVALVEKGALAGENPASIAAWSDFIITMLPDTPDVKKVVLGEKGIIEGAHEGLYYADMSTIAPTGAIEVIDALSEKGVKCLDAPVSGGQAGAEGASLSIMVGGEQSVFDEFLPIFTVLGKTITFCGAKGSGQIVKACNQIQVAMNFVGLAEALVLGTKAGVDPAVIVKVLRGGYAQTRVMDVRGPKMIRRDFTPGFKGRFHYKDLNIIMKTALDYGVPLPATSVVHELFASMMAKGNGELDHSAILTVIEDLAGVKVQTKEE